MKQIDLNNEIVIYQSEDGKTQLDVKTIGKHINNALKEELDDGIPTVAKFATVQKEATRHPRRLRLSAVEHQQDHQQGDLSRHLRECHEGNQCAEKEV